MGFISPKLVVRFSCGSVNERACLMPYLMSSEQPPQVHLVLCLLRGMRSHWQVVSSPLVQKRVIVQASEAELMALRSAMRHQLPSANPLQYSSSSSSSCRMRFVRPPRSATSRHVDGCGSRKPG
uniref:Uncharacterized protein n=1 Tax=Anopheles merus TaxID=30066 RepID=A0A182V3P8_ANOME